MSTEAIQWELPEAAESSTTSGIRHVYARVNQATGMSAAGWGCLGGGLAGLGLGLMLGWVEFIVVGVLATTLVALCLLFTIGRPKLGVWVQISDHCVVVGERAEGQLLVRNQARRRHWGSRLDLPVGKASASFSLPMLMPDEVTAQTFRIPTSSRGVVFIGPARSVQGDPFALTGRETRWTETLALYVHPRTVLLSGRQTGFVHDLEGHASPHLSAADMNFHALRPYAPGDDRRHVHWRSSARAGQLMVRQFEESRMSQVMVALDTGRSAYLDAQEFELAVSCAASVALQALYADSSLAFLTSTNRLISVTPGRILDELSLVEQSVRGGVADLVHGAIRREPWASVVLCVTGSMASLLEMRQACGHFDVDTRVVGLRIEEGAPLRARTTGNVTLLQVGSLEELPRAMRKAME